MASDATSDDPQGQAAASSDASPVEAKVSRSEEPHTGASLVMAPWQAIVLSLLAGALVWGALEVILPVFKLSDELAELTGPAIAPRLEEIQRELASARIKNAALGVAMLAAALALLLAVGEALYRRNVPKAIWGGLLAGLVAGAIGLGAVLVGDQVAGAVGLHAGPQTPTKFSPLTKTVMVQAAILGLMGLGVGLAISLPIFRPRVFVTCVMGCVMGGLLAALLFPMAASTLLPNMKTEDLMPEKGIGRLLWIGLATGLIGATVAGLGKEKKAAT